MMSSNDSDSNKYTDSDSDLALAWNYARQNNWLYNVDEDDEISFKKDERIANPWMLAQEELKRHAKKYTSNEKDYKKELHNLQGNVFIKNDSLSRSATKNALIKSVKNLALARNLCAAEPGNWNEIPGFSFDNPTPIFLNKKNKNIISTNDMANMEIERCHKEISRLNDMKAQSQGSYLKGRSDQDLKEIGQILARGRNPPVYELIVVSPSANQEDNERVYYQSEGGDIEASVREDEITITGNAAGGSASSKEPVGMKDNIIGEPNPINTYNIAIPLINLDEPHKAHIYLLRQQTPEHILSKIDANYLAVLDRIQFLQGLGVHFLTRIGYFKFEYKAPQFKFEYKASQFKLYYVNKPDENIPGFDSIHRNAQGDIIYPFLSYEQFGILLQESEEFRTLFSGLVEKTIYEIFIRKNLHTDVDFEQIVSLDLYPNRAKDESTVLKFHLDATPDMPTAFFTLMYLMPENIKIKGPTIVTRTEMPVRNQVTLIVENGTIIGVDNDVVLHATTDSIVRIFEEELVIPANDQNQHPEFNLLTKNKDEMIESYRSRRIIEEMEKGINENYAPAIVDQEIRDTIRMVQQNTSDVSRSFIRTWYLDRTVVNESSLSELIQHQHFQIDMDYIQEQISIFNSNSTIIVTNKKEDPDIIIFIEKI